MISRRKCDVMRCATLRRKFSSSIAVVRRDPPIHKYHGVQWWFILFILHFLSLGSSSSITNYQKSMVRRNDLPLFEFFCLRIQTTGFTTSPLHSTSTRKFHLSPSFESLCGVGAASYVPSQSLEANSSEDERGFRSRTTTQSIHRLL